MGASGGIIIGQVEHLKFKIVLKKSNVLGEGKFGIVYPADCVSKILPVKTVVKIVDIKANAVKKQEDNEDVLAIEKDMKMLFDREVEILIKLKGKPNFVQFYDYFETSKKVCYLFMERIYGFELRELFDEHFKKLQGTKLLKEIVFKMLKQGI